MSNFTGDFFSTHTHPRQLNFLFIPSTLVCVTHVYIWMEEPHAPAEGRGVDVASERQTLLGGDQTSAVAAQKEKTNT